MDSTNSEYIKCDNSKCKWIGTWDDCVEIKDSNGWSHKCCPSCEHDTFTKPKK